MFLHCSGGDDSFSVPGTTVAGGSSGVGAPVAGGRGGLGVAAAGGSGGLAAVNTEPEDGSQASSPGTPNTLSQVSPPCNRDTFSPVPDLDHVPADQPPSPAEDHWEPPPTRARSPQARACSPHARARPVAGRTPSVQRKRKRTGDAGQTTWQQDMLSYIKGHDEDEYDHFGRQLAAVMRRLPKRKCYAVQQEVFAIMMREDTD